MQFTTRAKLTLKQHLPDGVFQAIRSIAGYTVLKIQPTIFHLRTHNFSKREIKNVRYSKGEFKLVIDPANGFLDAQIYTGDPYESHIVGEFIANIKPGDTCIDIGANIGHHTIIMSQLVGDNGSVIAFEPIPFIRSQLEESLSVNEAANVQVVPEALSDKPGDLTLHINRLNVAGSSFVNNQQGESVHVNVRTLDSYALSKVDFIKLDVEGFEYHVLLGATNTIETLRPIVLFEFSPVYYREHNEGHTLEILRFFLSKNYTLIDLEDDKKTVAEAESFALQFNDGLRSQTNILAVPN